MKEIPLTYLVSEIAEKVEQLTYLLASARKDGAGNMRIADFALSSDNSVVIERAIAPMVAELNKKLCAYLDAEQCITVADGVVCVPLRVVADCPAATQATLQTQLEEFMVNFICSEWLVMKQLEEASTLLARADYLLSSVQVLLNRRTTPIRRPRNY